MSFLAINLSEAFSFPENPRAVSDAPDALAQQVKPEAEVVEPATAKDEVVVVDGKSSTAPGRHATKGDEQT